MNLIFVYGTLKRGGSNHHHLATQTFIGSARTVSGYSLYKVGDYPGMVAHAAATQGVEGEVWSVDDNALKHLDVFEGAPEGLYRRERVLLRPPFADRIVEAYFYPHSVEGRAKLGPAWTE